MIKICAVTICFFLIGCANFDLEPACSPGPDDDVVYVVVRAWHAELAIPVGELGPQLVSIQNMFPTAKVLMFGYGKRTFFTAPAHSFSEYVLGPFPGPAAIHVVGLSGSPLDSFDPADVMVIHLPQGGRNALANFIWDDLTSDSDVATPISKSKNPEGLFFAAASEYNLVHTCNTWVIDALRAAGLPMSGGPVAFSSQVTSRVSSVATAQCHLVRGD